METSLRWTSADLALMPDDGKRYEIVDGELFVSRQPDWHHQLVSGRVFTILDSWSLKTGDGSTSLAPGIIFSDDNDVAPDVVWASSRRLREGLDADGHLHVPPELVVEILSPGSRNEQRDREAKLKLYSRRGVEEYWIVDWRTQTFWIYRRDAGALRLVRSLSGGDVLESPNLPGLAIPLARIFTGLPRQT